MTPGELVALKWVESKLRLFACRECGGAWISGRTTAAIFHQCLRPREAMSFRRGVEETNAVRNRRWAEQALGLNPIATALEAALGEQAWLPPDPTIEETA